MDVEQGLREYLEIKAYVAYLENELNLLRAKGQAGAAAYGIPAVGGGMAGQEEGAPGGLAPRLAAKLESRRYMLRKLDALLSALDERERFVARKYYIEHMTWRDVVAAYNSEMQSPREVDALKAVRRRMLDKIERLQKSCS